MKSLSCARLVAWALLVLFGFLGTLLLSGCQTRRMIVPPYNPDLAPATAAVVKAKVSVEKAQAGTVGATAAVERAKVIVERLVVDPSQAAAVAELKIELATTRNELVIASAELAEISTQLAMMEVTHAKAIADIAAMKAWGVDQQERREMAEARWVKADKAVWNRNKMIVLQWLIVVGLLAWIFKDPLILSVRKLATGV